jgi:hypothetical protein
MFQKSSLLLLLLGCCSFVFPQQIVNSIPLNLKKDRVAFQVVNDSTKQTVLFLGDKSHATAFRLDNKMELIDTLSAPKPEKTYEMMVGYNTSGISPRLFWSSSNHKSVYSQFYDFEKKAISGQQYSIPFEEDRFLQFFSGKDKFYILSVIRKSNNFKLYVFDNAGKMKEHVIDLGNAKFIDHNNKITNVYGLLGDDFYGMERPYEIQKILPENLTSLTESSKKRKCYINDKSIVITFDTTADFTQVLSIDLKKFKADVKVIQQPFVNIVDRAELNSNSFVLDNQLFQFKTSSQKIFFSIKDMQGNLIKEYMRTPDEELDFKNSPIIQESGDIENARILEKTAQFIRKANNQNSGLSVVKINDNYMVTLGSVSDARQSTGMVAGGMFGAAGVLIAYALSNPTYQNFDSYSNRKVVYINCLFDKSGNHLDGTMRPLAFDNIRRFMKDREALHSPTIYKLDDFYYLGYNDQKEKKYVIRKFEQ